MDWTTQIDIYCERTDFSFWSEPLNALTNGFYLLAAALMYRRCREDDLPIARLLAVLLGLIAIGSFLFHTLATQWAALADTAPIVGFIVLYLFAVHRDVLGLVTWVAVLMTVGFVPYAAIMLPLINQVPFLAISNFYWLVPILLVAYTPLVARRRRETAQGMVAGAALLSLSITLRSIDGPLCHHWPHGTHIGWHTLNAIMLPMMIEVYRRHMLASRARLR